MNIFRKREVQSTDTPFAKAWKRFKHNMPARISLYLLVLLIIIAVLGYSISTDSTTNCNTIIPGIAFLKTGARITLVKVPSMESSKPGIIKVMITGDDSRAKYLPVSNYSLNDSSVVVEEIKGEGLSNEKKILPFRLFASLDNPDPDGAFVEKSYILHRRFLLGTDNFGRDIYSRLLLGLRISLSVGLIAVLISLVVGISLGSLAGYLGGRSDTIIQWIMNVVWAIPTVLLVFAITIVLGKGFWQIFIAVGLTIWVGAARIIRGQVMQVKQMEYIEAAHSLGYSTYRIIIHHILPNILGPVMVIAASNFATAILLEAGLSFLGIGVQPPTPSWGAMIKDNYGAIISDNPFIAIIPGLAIMVLVLLINLVGNGIRDAFDVKTKSAG